MKGSIVTVSGASCLSLALGFLTPRNASGAIAFQHVGSNNPATEGFTVEGNPNGSAHAGPPANWHMVQTSGDGAYAVTANFASTMNDPTGWTFTEIAKLNDGNISQAMVRLRDATNRFEVQLLDAAAGPEGAGLYYYTNFGTLSSRVGTVDPTDGFHTYKLLLDPGGNGVDPTDTVTWYVDGVLTLSLTRADFQGAGTGDPNLATGFFGNGTGSSPSNVADAHYALVRLETGQHPIDQAPGWALNGSGDWNVGANWFGGIPSSGGTANFTGAISAAQTVFTDTAVTVGTLKFDNANSYQITGQGSLTLQPSSGDALVNVVQGTHKINLPLTIASNTTLQVANGAMLKISDPVIVNAGMSLSQSGTGIVNYESTLTLLTGASASLANSSHMAALTLNSAAVATVTQGGDKLLHVDTLGSSAVLIPAGKLDLKDNKLITHSALGSWNGSNYTGVTGSIKSGRNGGAWNGNGIVTSMSAAANGLTTLAVATAGDVGKSTFGGQSVNSTDVLVMYTYAGDATLSGAIDGDDFSAIDAGFSANATGYHNGDFDYSGNIDADDYFIIDSNYGKQTLGVFPSALPVGEVTAVPEPAGFALMGIAIAGLLARRRHLPPR